VASGVMLKQDTMFGAGDYTFPAYDYLAVITSNTKKMIFDVPMTFRINPKLSPSITKLGGSIRVVDGGYSIGADDTETTGNAPDFVNNDAYNVSVTYNRLFGIRITVQTDGGFVLNNDSKAAVTNNTPATFTGGFTVTFS